MGHQKGVLKIKGLVGNMIFYKTQYGDLVRGRGTLDKNRIANDPSFLRTREINTEFGNAVRAGKLLRTTVRSMGMNAFDNRVTSRINKMMSGIKSFDVTSGRGKRTVGNGIADEAARRLIKGFNFNAHAVLGRILLSSYSVATDTGVITIDDFIPSRHVVFPEGATHVTLQAGFGRINFSMGDSELQVSNVVNLIINGNSTDVVLAPAAVPTLNGTSIYLLKISFLQLIGGVQYMLKDGAFNSLAIVEIA